MKQDYGKKIRAIRLAEGMTQATMANECGITLLTIKDIESGDADITLSTLERVIATTIFEKYTLWLLLGKTSEAAGQVSPALSHSGPEKTE